MNATRTRLPGYLSLSKITVIQSATSLLTRIRHGAVRCPSEPHHQVRPISTISCLDRPYPRTTLSSFKMSSKPKPKQKFEVREYTTQKDPVAASPSASIILVSPKNEILLLHRVKSSSAFPSAHVFPGGNLDPQDGTVPSDPTDPERHKDSLAYRTGAIRELFEETGILLAKASPTATSLLPLSPEVRLSGRKAVHSGKISFKDWLAAQSKDAVLHTEGLTPFTHWVTPPYVRLSTTTFLTLIHPTATFPNASPPKCTSTSCT